MIRLSVVKRLRSFLSALLVAALLVGVVWSVPWLPAAFAVEKSVPAAGEKALPPSGKVMPPDGKVASTDVNPLQPGEKVAAAETKMALPINLPAEAVQIAGYLLIFIALAVFVVYLGRRFRPQWRGGGPIFIEDGRNLAPGVGVRLLRVGSRYFLVGVTKERVSLLGELTEEELLEEDLADDVVVREPAPVLSKGRSARDIHESEPSFIDQGVRR